jgi:hypothetical protein
MFPFFDALDLIAVGAEDLVVGGPHFEDTPVVSGGRRGCLAFLVAATVDVVDTKRPLVAESAADALASEEREDCTSHLSALPCGVAPAVGADPLGIVSPRSCGGLAPLLGIVAAVLTLPFADLLAVALAVLGLLDAFRLGIFVSQLVPPVGAL